jgi:hypothetical protein
VKLPGRWVRAPDGGQPRQAIVMASPAGRRGCAAMPPGRRGHGPGPSACLPGGEGSMRMIHLSGHRRPAFRGSMAGSRMLTLSDKAARQGR